MPDTIQSAPAPAAAPVATPVTPAAPTSAPASPAPAAPVSPVRAALASLPQNASWADAMPAIRAATAETASGAPPTPAAPDAASGGPPAQPRDAQGRFASPDTDPNPTTDAAPSETSPGAALVSGEDGDAAAPDGDEAAPDGEAAPEPITITLRGRNGEEIPFTVESEADADVLRALKNDGMRGEEYRRKSADLESGFAELRDIGARMKADPEGFMISQLTPERQLSTARALLLNNWDHLAPEIEQFWNDDVARRQAMLDIREQSTARTADVNNLIAGYRAAAEAERTIAGLIPEAASQEESDAFFADATAYLTGLAQQGRAVNPADIPQVLSRMVAAYGFHAATAPAAVPATPATQAAAPSAPASDPLAERKERVAAVVRRTAQVAKQRTAAARVAPQGAGAAPVEAPKPPKGSDITQTTQFLKQRIRPGMTWTDFFGRGR